MITMWFKNVLEEDQPAFFKITENLVLCAEKTAEIPALCMVVLIHLEMVSFNAFFEVRLQSFCLDFTASF